MLRIPPLSAWSSALVAAALGFGGTIALVIQAMANLGASVDQTGSAVTALCLGIAVAGAALSFRLRVPVVLAWSTPGAALLATAQPLPWPVACGVFLAAGLMTTMLGAIPALARLAAALPASIASAMLAGVLLPFGLEVFRLAPSEPLLVVVLLTTFLVARRIVPLYALLIVLAAGVAITLLRGDVGAVAPGATFGRLSAPTIAFDAGAVLGVGVPLFLVTLMSQNLPGMAVLRTAGYAPRPAPLLLGTGLATIASAPFGGHGLNLAAITAAICTTAEADPDRSARWRVGMLYAGCYLVLALFSPALVRLFLALPHAAIAVLTGLAIIPALIGALEAMLAAPHDRDATIVTFLITASGMTLLGLGSAFWGIAGGFLALGATKLARRRGGAAALHR